MQYKVLTLWEPWATLLVHGIKKIETRPKATSWIVEKDLFGNVTKGTYLIHSAKKWTKEQLRFCSHESIWPILEKLNIDFTIALGCIQGSIEVVKCIPINIDEEGGAYLVDSNRHYCNCIDDKEQSFGDYREGRYAWICQNPRILKKPIPYKNGQGYYQNFKGDESQLIFMQ